MKIRQAEKIYREVLSDRPLRYKLRHFVRTAAKMRKTSHALKPYVLSLAWKKKLLEKENAK